MNFDLMVATIEEYIFQRKATKIRINKQVVYNDVRQIQMLILAYNQITNKNTNNGKA